MGFHFTPNAADGWVNRVWVSGFGGLGCVDISASTRGTVTNSVLEDCSTGVMQSSSVGRIVATGNIIRRSGFGYKLDGVGSSISGGYIEGAAIGVDIRGSSRFNNIVGLVIKDVGTGIVVFGSDPGVRGIHNVVSSIVIQNADVGIFEAGGSYNSYAHITMDRIGTAAVDFEKSVNHATISHISADLDEGALGLIVGRSVNDLSFNNLVFGGSGTAYSIDPESLSHRPAIWFGVLLAAILEWEVPGRRLSRGSSEYSSLCARLLSSTGPWPSPEAPGHFATASAGCGSSPPGTTHSGQRPTPVS